MIIAEAKIHLVACKEKEYQRRILMMYQALAEFLTSNKMVTQNLFTRFQESPETFEIHSEDLTEAGFDWIKSNLDRCMRNIDRRKKPMEYEDYQKSLVKTLK
jgi:hypothetical protein